MATTTSRATNEQIPEIERKIEARIAADSELFTLDSDDIQDIRDEIYEEYGFDGDPFYEEEEEEEEEEDDDYWFDDNWHYWREMSDIRAKLIDIGMSERDFF